MDLQISVFLLFILFTAGHTLSCYECSDLTGSCDPKLKTCPGGSQCISITTVSQQGLITSKLKTKDCAVDCRSGSMNFGIPKVSISCCNTDQCNIQDAPDPPTIPNGRKCYFCDGQNCSNTVSCSGNEDRCFKATGDFRGHSLVAKGCVPKSFCDSTFTPNAQSTSCCEGNLCNGARVSQSFLFLCCSLLYFLML